MTGMRTARVKSEGTAPPQHLDAAEAVRIPVSYSTFVFLRFIIRNVTAAPATAAAATAAITVMTVRFVPEFSASGSAVSSVLSLSGVSVSVMLFAVSCVFLAFPADASAEAPNAVVSTSSRRRHRRTA